MESVIEQIRSDASAYSVFFLARVFLEKPQRYDVHLKSAGQTVLYQLGEDGPISADKAFLEASAFRLAKEKFYNIEVTQSEPLKGNFSSVARCRLSGTILGPTNHHAYQGRLRSLFERRFSRRMSFAEYQRQIEIVTDPAAVEQWKEDARNVTTFTTREADSPNIFRSAAEAERHFRQTYLPDVIRAVTETTIDGLTSRQMADRKLQSHIEQQWSAESRSPSKMMQELAGSFRQASLHIFRHRRGMLFVSPIRPRPFVHGEAAVSDQVKAILQTIAASPRIHRKDLADKLLKDQTGEDVEARKLALASDLRWLINEGHVIEFNDGSLDLPRMKEQPQTEVNLSAESPAENANAAMTPAAEIGGS